MLSATAESLPAELLPAGPRGCGARAVGRPTSRLAGQLPLMARGGLRRFPYQPEAQATDLSDRRLLLARPANKLANLFFAHVA